MHYVPILKGKNAEYKALQDLTPDVRPHITPLIELLPPKTEDDADPLIESTVSRLSRAWPGQLFFLDAGPIGSAITSTGEHPLLRLWHWCRDQGLKFAPVTGLSSTDAYQEATQEIAHGPNGAGICLRLSGNDFEGDFSGSAASDVVHGLGLSVSDADLLLDFGSLPAEKPGPVAMLMHGYLQAVSNLASWRSVIVSSTSFPRDMSGFKPDTINRLPRTEWKAWLSLLAKPLSRRPQFSDYAIQHPQMVDFDPKLMDVSAALRYSADEQWVIVKGRGLKKNKALQMHALSAQLIALPEYKGAGFSLGDKWIDDCAHRRVNYGNSMVWRRVGTGHHLTLVARQLANIPSF